MIRRLFTNRWFIGSLGILALAVIVYFLGPLFAFGPWRPLESTTARWIFILLIVIVWLIRRIVALVGARKRDQSIVDGIVEAPADDAASVGKDEVETLQRRFEEAVAVIRKSRSKRGRVSLYDLPWYIIIGPPGAGKTTALMNSGLNFPLADRFGPEAIQGVGGTRNCDWWFTDDSIIIDTAGRYTTQDSDSRADQAAWLGFLDLLKKYRKRRPINGIFVAIGLSDLLMQSDEERQEHARAIRDRIRELNEHFRISFPIYVLFTKCDLVAGFTEYFEDFGQIDREQVWGVTFPFDESGNDSPLDDFEHEFDQLIDRLDEGLIERLAEEPDRRRRILIHGFSLQMDSLRPLLSNFLQSVFASSRYDAAPLLRGFYFTSGTQEGTPIDRMLSSLASTFRISPEVISHEVGAGKSYFVTDVFRRVVFGESELAGTNRRLERRRNWLKKTAYAATAAALVLLLAGWFVNYGAVKRDLDRALEMSRIAAGQISEIDPRNLDPLTVVPSLDTVRQIPGGFGERAEGTVPWRLGLSQADKVGDVAVGSYRRILEQAFLPRLMLRLERQLQSGGPSPDYAYEALKAYLMLDSEEHYDPDSIRAFLEFDWTNNLRREVSTEQRESLLIHVDALLEERPERLPLPLDQSLIELARRDIRGLPLEYRIYGRLKRTVEPEGPGFNVRDAAGGAESEYVFVRKSGASLGEPLDPLFTRRAYQEEFVSASRGTTSRLVEESWWILGETEQIGPAEEERLLGRVRELYLDEFASAYADLIDDIGLAPFSTPQEAMRIFNILARPEDSPLLLLIQSIADETRLEDLGANASATARIEGRAAEALRQIQDVLGTQSEAPDTVEEALIANAVQRRFRALNRLVDAEEGQPRPVDRLLDLFRELYVYMSNVASESAGGAIPPQVQSQGRAVTQQMKIEAASQPELLVGDILTTSADRSVALTTGGLQVYLNELWRSGPLQICRAAIESRYPIARGSSQTIRLDDFGQFFGYSGTMDSFFNNHLRQYVDSTRSPWRVRQTANVPIRISADALRAFENADIIKRTFFRQGSMDPGVSFDLRPLEMDTGLSRFQLDLEGKIVTYEFGPKLPTFMQWPGPNPGSEVRIEMRDRQSGRTIMDRRQGAWAWFRLLDDSRFQPTPIPEQFEITFSIDGREVLYELIARSAFNPFALSELQSFRCPQRL